MGGRGRQRRGRRGRVAVGVHQKAFSSSQLSALVASSFPFISHLEFMDAISFFFPFKNVVHVS